MMYLPTEIRKRLHAERIRPTTFVRYLASVGQLGKYPYLAYVGAASGSTSATHLDDLSEEQLRGIYDALDEHVAAARKFSVIYNDYPNPRGVTP
jgi:hypothetical protein